MKLPEHLLTGTLIRRYQRFLADVSLDSGETITVHCPNSGSMTGCALPGSRVIISRSDRPGRKYPCTWELVEVGGCWIGINTGITPTLVREAIVNGVVTELQGYGTIRPEVRRGDSRLDLLLRGERGTCWVEVKNVTLAENGLALFPDAVTVRGQKHLTELIAVVRNGERGVIFFVVQRGDCRTMAPADRIDPRYGALLREAAAAGVEALAYRAEVSPAGVALVARVPVDLGQCEESTIRKRSLGERTRRFFMAQAIQFSEYGGPEVLRMAEIAVGEPGPGEARIRHTACGLNFIDIYQRTGLYKVDLPSGLGLEGAGVVEAVGPDVTVVKPGDRVAYAGGPVGAYATERLIPANRLCHLPDGLSFEQGAAMMLQGMTVQYLIRRTYQVQSGDMVLFHAAAGGVGLIACQWLKALGAKVIGTAGSAEKCILAKQHGADHCINYRTENFVERVRELTGGSGVPVVYDSVGKDTFMGSLDCLRPRGLLVSFGNASGPVPPVDLGLLAQKGSLYITRPTLFTYTASRADLEATSGELFDIVLSGRVKIDIGQRYPLREVAQAHQELVARTTTGSSILLP